MRPVEQLVWSEIAALLRPADAVVEGLAQMLAAAVPLLLLAGSVAFVLVLLVESVYQGGRPGSAAPDGRTLSARAIHHEPEPIP